MKKLKSIDRQLQIYERLATKGFAATNIVLGVGSFTYQFNTRDTLGFAAKGAWFEIEEKRCSSHPETAISNCKYSDTFEDGKTCSSENVCSVGGRTVGVNGITSVKTAYNIYKDPITDDGSKKSLKGLQAVFLDDNGEPYVKSECTWDEENTGLLQVIYEDGKFYNQTTLAEIRERLNNNI